MYHVRVAILTILGSALTCHGAAQSSAAQTPTAADSAGVAAYVNTVLDVMRESWVHADRADWPALRRDALAAVANARSTRDAYPALRRVLEQAGDRHSRLLAPEEARVIARGQVSGFGVEALYPEGTIVRVYPGSAAERAGIRPGDRLERVGDGPVRPDWRGMLVDLPGDTLRVVVTKAASGARQAVVLVRAVGSVNAAPAARRLPRGIGYLEVPEHLGNGGLGAGAVYQELAQREIERVDRPAACGWIVDLRRNAGGNMWPMLAGVGPIQGEGDAGAFVARGRTSPWSYRAGRASSSGVTTAEVTRPYVLARPAPPVAVLITRLTASAGEAIAIAFRGRASVRTFGEATAGLPTANVLRPLPDGALLVLTTALDADRTGRTYDGSIEPDERVPTDWSRFGTDADPVVAAATRWLNRQPACRRP